MVDSAEWSQKEELEDYLNEKVDAFDRLCDERHQEGQNEYGALSFLGNDVLRMMLEELADTVNYCRMQAIKLLILQEQLESQMSEGMGFKHGEDLQIGFESFKGTKDAGWGN